MGYQERIETYLKKNILRSKAENEIRGAVVDFLKNMKKHNNPNPQDVDAIIEEIDGHVDLKELGLSEGDAYFIAESVLRDLLKHELVTEHTCITKDRKALHFYGLPTDIKD